MPDTLNINTESGLRQWLKEAETEWDAMRDSDRETARNLAYGRVIHRRAMLSRFLAAQGAK